MSRDAFEELTAELEGGGNCAFYALFRQAQLQLMKERPEGFEVSEIGRRAWSQLPVEEYGATLNSFFYSYWSVLKYEEDASARYELERSETLLELYDVASVKDLLDDDPSEIVPVDRPVLARMAAEIQRLHTELAARPSRPHVLRDAAAEGVRWASGAVERRVLSEFGLHLRRLAATAEAGEGRG